jgi:hypothetical protein
VDTQTGKLLGPITDTAGAHGVALTPARQRGYTSNGQANISTEFDYAALAVKRTMPLAGANPDAILYRSNGRHPHTCIGPARP